MGKDRQIEVRLRFDSKKVSRQKVIKMTEYCLKPFGIEVWVKDDEADRSRVLKEKGPHDFLEGA